MCIYVILVYVLYLYKERYKDGKVNGLISGRCDFRVWNTSMRLAEGGVEIKDC